MLVCAYYAQNYGSKIDASLVLCWCRAGTTCEGVLELARHQHGTSTAPAWHQHGTAPEMQVYTANLGVLVPCWCCAGSATGGRVNTVLVTRMLSRALALAGIVIIIHSQTGIQQVIAVAATYVGRVTVCLRCGINSVALCSICEFRMSSYVVTVRSYM